MDEQKRMRLAAAVTVNVILLIVVLTAVIIYQLATIVSVNNKRAEIKKEIETYNQMLDETQNDLEYIKTKEFLLRLAFEQGYRFPD